MSRFKSAFDRRCNRKKYEIEVNLVCVIFRFNERSDGFWQSVRRAGEKEDTFREQLQPSTQHSPEWTSVCFERAIEFFKLQRDFPWGVLSSTSTIFLKASLPVAMNVASCLDRIYAKQPIGTHSTRVAGNPLFLPPATSIVYFFPLNKVF